MGYGNRKMKKKVLVINLGWEQEPLLDKLTEYDVEIYGVHYDEDYYKKPRYKDILICDIRDLDKILAFAKKIDVDAVISDECDYSHFAQALVSQSLNIPGPRISEAQISLNKYLQRTRAKQNNILIPDYSLVTSIDDIYKFLKKVSFPIIIKPVDNRGSFGVNKINDDADIVEAYEDALVNSHSRLVIVEKFIEGKHITVDGYIFRNEGIKSLAIADKILAPDNRQVALDIQYPASFSSSFYNEILKINENVNSALGYRFGMTHSEYMVTKDNQVYLIESANRGGGVYTSEVIVPNVSGVDILSQYICDALDMKKSFVKKRIERNKVILKFFNLKAGKIQDIKGIHKFIKYKEILKFKIFLRNGDIIKTITNDANRHGFVIALNKDIDIEKMIKENIEVIYES